MAQYFVQIKEDGNIRTFYLDDIHGDAIPETAIPITAEQYEAYSAAPHRYKLDGSEIREKTADELAAELEAARAALDYATLRRPEYPPIGDQLDALWKWLEPPEGTEAAEMRARWLAVKQQYPKPNEGGEHAE